MKETFRFLIIIIALCACGHRNEDTATKQNSVSTDSINNRAFNKTNEKTELAMPEGERHEDSLRSAILRKKENAVLKESFLQEMYIRNVATISSDSVFVTIPFNLHGPDCGAPDCYSTDIHFSFKLDATLVFPKTFQFQEHEHGCVDKEKKLSGSFELVEETRKHVIYHSGKHKRTLVLFRSNKENGTTAYYFTGVRQNRINGQNVYTIVKDYNEGDTNSVYPFTSWVLTTNEYENFIH